jgi:hypothetical protein
MQVLAWIVNQQECLQLHLPRLVAFRSAFEHGNASSSTFLEAAANPAEDSCTNFASETQQQGQQTNNYCCSLLAATTEHQWMEVLQMSPHVSAGNEERAAILKQQIRSAEHTTASAHISDNHSTAYISYTRDPASLLAAYSMSAATCRGILGHSCEGTACRIAEAAFRVLHSTGIHSILQQGSA